MNRRLPGPLSVTPASPPVAKSDVKICALCGTLNHTRNLECWTCRWGGEFSRDEEAAGLAWARLEFLYEEVRLEHLTAPKRAALGDFGTVQQTGRWRAAMNACRHWWRALRVSRARSAASRGTGNTSGRSAGPCAS